MTIRARQTFVLFLSAALLPTFALVLPHLQRRDSSTTALGYGPASEKLRIALVTNNAADYWTVARYGAEQAARQTNVDLVFKLPAEGTFSEQARVVDEVLASGVDGIAVAPVNAANQGAMLHEVAQKTLLFTFDTDDTYSPGSKRTCFVGHDNIRAARQAGEELKRVLPQGGDIMVFAGTMDVPNATERFVDLQAGLQQALNGSRVRILGLWGDDADPEKARSNISDAIAKHPSLAGCVGLGSYNGPAILSAIRDAGKVGKVKVVCFDEEDETLDGIQSGAISATIVSQPALEAATTVRVMAQVLAGDKSAIPASRRIVIPTLAIRKSNVAAFRAQLNKMRRK